MMSIKTNISSLDAQKNLTGTENDLNNNELWDVSVRAEGRSLLFSNRFRKPMDTNYFNSRLNGLQKIMRDAYCAEDNWLLRRLKDRDFHILQS